MILCKKHLCEENGFVKDRWKHGLESGQKGLKNCIIFVENHMGILTKVVV